MNARALPRWSLPALPFLTGRRRRHAAVVVAAALLVALVAALALGWPLIARREAARPSDPGLAAARAQAIAAARAHAARPPTPAQRAADAPTRKASSRVAPAQWMGDLFATHSWYVPPPPPPPAPVSTAPPPPPTAPPFPYVYVGRYLPDGGTAVYFLSRSDRVLDAHVGDRIDGVYEFESSDGAQLVFNYLPLNIRQTVPTGAVP